MVPPTTLVLRLEREAAEAAARQGLLAGPAQRIAQGGGVGGKRALHLEGRPVADVAVEGELERRAGEPDLEAGAVAVSAATKSVKLMVASIGSSCQANRPVAAKLLEIDGQASDNSTFASVSTIL